MPSAPAWVVMFPHQKRNPQERRSSVIDLSTEKVTGSQVRRQNLQSIPRLRKASCDPIHPSCQSILEIPQVQQHLHSAPATSHRNNSDTILSPMDSEKQTTILRVVYDILVPIRENFFMTFGQLGRTYLKVSDSWTRPKSPHIAPLGVCTRGN